MNTVSSDKKWMSMLTLYGTFLMGFIDAYTFLEQGGVFVSAQTGNMIAFSSKLFTGQFTQAVGHVTVFIGFALGAFVGEIAIEKVKGTPLQKYRLVLLIQGIVLAGFALFQQQLTNSLMVFLLGSLAGYELTVFRKVGITTVNDGIMTGNTKNLMNNVFKMLFDHDAVAKQECKNIGLVMVTFVLGVGMGSILTLWIPVINLWLAALLTIVIFLLLSRRKKVM